MIVLLMMAAVLHVQTVNSISHLTDPNAVIQLGMSLVLTVQHWKATITGIALVVDVLVMQQLCVVMVIVLATKTMKIVQKIVNQNLPVKLQVVMIAG